MTKAVVDAGSFNINGNCYIPGENDEEIAKFYIRQEIIMLKHVHCYQENGNWYMSLKYEFEDENGKRGKIMHSQNDSETMDQMENAFGAQGRTDRRAQ